MPLDLRNAALGLNPVGEAAGFEFQPNDILSIPESSEKYAVLGEARTPGNFAYPSAGKITVLEAYTQVGGATASGDLANAGIIRFTGGQYTVAPVNIAKLLQKKGTEVNPPLEPGDTLYIPTKKVKGGFSWQSLLTPLSALSLLGLRL